MTDLSEIGEELLRIISVEELRHLGVLQGSGTHTGRHDWILRNKRRKTLTLRLVTKIWRKKYYCIPMINWLIVSLTLLWMKVSAKCLNINVMHACMFNSIFVFAAISTLKGIKKFAQHRANPWAPRTWATLKACALILWCKSNSDITVWLGQCKCSVHNMYTAPPKKKKSSIFWLG